MKKVLNQLKKNWKIALVVVAVLGIFLFRQNQQAKTASQKTFTVEKHTVKESQIYSGEVDATEKAVLKFQTGGRLAWVGAKEGDTVNKFQSIASLDQRQLSKELNKDLNNYLKSRSDFDQTQDDNKVITNDRIKRIVDKSQYDLNNAVLDVEIQSLTAEFASIFSPIYGVVTQLNYPNAGVNIGIADIIAEVVNPSTIYFSALVDQVDLANIQEGMVGEITFDTYPDVKVPATIESISFTPKEDETGTVYEVKMSFADDNSTLRYRLGMTGDVEFIFRELPGTLTVPNTFLKNEGNQYFVFKKVGNKNVKTNVVRGATFETETEIVEGLNDGDVIIDAD